MRVAVDPNRVLGHLHRPTLARQRADLAVGRQHRLPLELVKPLCRSRDVGGDAVPNNVEPLPVLLHGPVDGFPGLVDAALLRRVAGTDVGPLVATDPVEEAHVPSIPTIRRADARSRRLAATALESSPSTPQREG
jgi:hypothetical protein